MQSLKDIPRLTALSLFGAVLLVLSFPDHSLWYLAWIAFTPLLLAARLHRSVFQSFWTGLSFGAVFFYGSSYWITNSMIDYGGLHPVLAYLVAIVPAVVLGAFSGLFSSILTLLVRRLGEQALWAAPLVWTATEYTRHHLTAMGWNAAGYSQSFTPPMLWPARYGGVYLVSALLLIPAVGLVVARKGRLLSLATLLLPVAIYLTGRGGLEIKTAGGTGIDIVAVQANAPVGDVPVELLNEALSRQIAMTNACLDSLGERKRPVLVVWPETPFGFPVDTDAEIRRSFEEYVRKHQIYLIFNANTEKPGGTRNSVLLLEPSGERIGVYDKIQLLPFGEYVPLRGFIPFIDRVPALAGEFKAGSEHSLLSFDGYRIGASICFEAVFPELNAEFARRGANLLINIADDAWFGIAPEARQHLAHSVMRSVETGLPQFRVTNTGITARISPDGRVDNETRLFENASRVWHLTEPLPVPTFYVRYGDAYALSATVLTLLLMLVSLARKMEEKNVRGTETEI